MIHSGRTLVLLAITGSAAMAQIQAPAPDDPFANFEARIARLEQQNNQLQSQLMARQPLQQHAHVLSPGILATNKGTGWIAGVDYLHWKVRQPGTEYGITDIGGVQDRGAVGRILDLDGDYGQAFRATLGYRYAIDCDCLFNRPEILVRYTNLGTDQTEVYNGPLRATFISSDNSENDDSDNINTLGVETITPDDRATSVTARHEFDYGVLDTELGQSIALNRAMNLRFAAIGRYAAMHETFNVTYTGGDFQTAYNSFRNWEYQGGGILLGTQVDWMLSKAFSLTINSKAGMMMGRYESRHFFPDDEPGVPTDVRSNTTRVTPVIELAALLNYTREFSGFDVSVGAGYEFSNWFNLVEDRQFSDSHMEGQNIRQLRDLSLDGFIGRITVNF